MLIMEKSRSLAMKLANPARVTSVIPSAICKEYNGSKIVALPHGLEEVRVLNNLGIKAPSPILHYYDWPGRFTPFEHQKNTAAFLTMHNRGLVLNQIGCVDADTEYLSPTGWRRIADYSGGPVAQYWPETGGIDFVSDPEFVKLPCQDMLHIKTRYGVDQLLSPEHRVLIRSCSNPDKRETLPAEELLARHDAWVRGERSKRSHSHITYGQAAIPTTFHTQGGIGVPLTDAQLRVQVAVIADGYIPEAGRMCRVRLKKQRKKDRLRTLLDEAHIPYSYRPCAPDGFHVVCFIPPMRTKVFGDIFWQATPDQLQVITDEVRYWDATVRTNKPRIEFFTSVKASADFIQYAFAACGYTARLMTYQRGDKTEYVVGASTTKRGYVQPKGTTDGKRLRAIEWAPSTDGFKYCFMVPSTYLVLRRNGCIFATGNTGKTQSALWAADYLIEAGAVQKVLILSPLSTLERVWGDAIFSNLLKRRHTVLHGTAQRRKKRLKEDADFYVINHDGFKVISDECIGMFDLVIVDEAAVYRNPSSQRFKMFRKWINAQPDIRLWLMTGTPTPNEPTDAWALATLAKSPYVPDSYVAFRDQVMYKMREYTWVPRPESAEIVKHILQPSVMYTRDECFDLPPTLTQTRSVELSATQKRYYADMLRSYIADVEVEGTITAVNEAAKMQKLIQIAVGVAYGDDGQHIELDCSPRVNVVKEVIEEAGGKVIVFVPLTGTLHMLERELSKHWTTAIVNGEVSASKRNVIFHNFQNAQDPKVLIAHPATMAHGLTLTAASTVIWYGPITSNEQYVQANGRVERIGKKHTSNVIHIQSTELEAKMYSRLKSKQTLQGLLLELIQQEMEKHK